MKCSTTAFEMNAMMMYECITNLTGMENKKENNFFFRCKDKPFPGVNESQRIENDKGYHFMLKGTEPLVIESYGPQGKIRGSATTAKVTLTAETAAGSNDGEATCDYSRSCFEKTGSKTKFARFDYGSGLASYTHSINIWVTQGKYNCVIRCTDFGGNMDKKEFSYEVEIDKTIPKIVRVYEEQGNLKIITDEEATCVYSYDNCNFVFGDGLLMDSVDGLGHFTEWNLDKTYYIRCQDKHGNVLEYGKCDIQVRPFSSTI